MAKRNKTKKLFKSNLKLEALEQRQLLAGITGSGTELTPGGSGADKFIVASNGNHYDQVLLTGTSVTVTNDTGNITRVSFLDLQGDIVQAEFGGAGTLTISLDPNTAVAGVQPTKYNQTLASGYEQGLATFTIQGSDATTNFTVFSVGSATAFPGNTLFDSTHTGGNNTADVQRLTIVANPANPNGSTFGGIRAGNAVFGAASGVVGISAANVQVQDVVTVGDIQASGTATPTLVFGTQSQFGSVTVAGGGLVEANGASINDTGSYKFGLVLAAGTNSAGTAIAAQTAPVGLSFSDNNPIAAQTKTFTLTTGVDTIVGSGGNDAINGQIGAGATLTALDSIDGGAGVNSLTINDVTGGSTVPGGVTIKNIQTLNLASAAAAGAVGAGNSFDISGLTGLTALNVVQSKGADYITAGSTQAVTVFDTAGVVTVTGGSTQTVTTAGGLALSGAAGAITATDTAQSTVASTIDGGTAVSLTATAKASPDPTLLVDTLTFQAMTAAGQTVTVLGTTFTSVTGAETAATVAGTFASGVNITTGAGVFWNSGAVVGNTVTFTATAAGTSDVKIIPTGTAPLPTVAQNAFSTGTITIGGTTKPTGAITVSDAITGNYLADTTAGGITVKGGTTVSVTESPTTTVNPTAGANTNFTVNQGSVSVTGGSATTSVTVVQAPTISAAATATAVAGVAEVDSVQFTAMAQGQKLTVAGLNFVAPAPLTATQVATAFANLANTTLTNYSSAAVSGVNSDTVVFTGKNDPTNVPVTNPAAAALVDTVTFANITAGQTVIINGLTYTDSGAGSTAAQVAAFFANQTNLSTGAGNSWSSSGVSGAGNNVVKFSQQPAGTADVTLVPGGTATAPTVTEVSLAGTATVSEITNGVASAGAGGRTGATMSTVSITDPNQGTGTASTISTVSLTNYSGTSTINSDALTSLTVINTATSTGSGQTALGTLNITNVTATSLDLTVNGGGNGGVGTIADTKNTYTTLKVHTTGSDSSATITDSSATSLTVDGTKKLSLTAAGLTKLATVAISQTASFSSSDLKATVTDINASATSGSVSVTLPAAGTTYEGGSGVDTVTITAAPTAAISGGAGTDVLTLATTTVSNPSANTFISGFETLATASGAATGTFDTTGFTALSNGQAGVSFTNVAAGVPLTVSGGGTTYTLKTYTGADSLTITATGSASVTANKMQTVNIAVGGNGTLTLADDSATSVVITNSSSGKNLTLAGANTTVTSVDGSAMSGSLTYTTAGSVAETVKGGTANDTLTAATGTTADVLVGGAGNDTLKANSGLDTLTGGSGNDTFVLAAAGTNLNTYSVITDASVGDMVQPMTKGNAVFNAGKVTLQNTAVFQDYANTVVNAGKDASTNGYVGWFQFNGDTYIVESAHNASTTPGFVDGQDQVIKLQGLVDLSNSVLMMSGTTPEIVIR